MFRSVFPPRTIRLFGYSNMLLLVAQLVWGSESVELRSFLPNEAQDYRSYLGTYRSDGEATDLHVRTETSSNFFINNRRAFRVRSQASSNFGDSEAVAENLSQVSFETSHNGWLVFREESNGKILEYDRPIRVLPPEPEFGKSYKYKSSLSEDSSEFGVVSYHTVVEGLTTVSLRNGTFEALKINQEKRIKIASDEKLKNIIFAATEYLSFWLIEGVGIGKKTHSTTSYEGVESDAVDYELELVASNYLPNYLWPMAENTPSGWKHVTWFGYLTDEFFPWIYHRDHGWLWIHASDTSDVKIWSETLGWWITSEALYPTFYSVDLQEWLTYNGDSDIVRTFVRSNGEILRASLGGFSSSPELSRPPQSSNDSLLNKEGTNEFFDSDGVRFVDSGNGFTPNQGELPTIEILSPFDDTILEEGQRVLVLVDAKDKDGEIMQVQIRVNGVIIALLDDTPYQTVFTVNDKDETCRIQATATDNDGNTVESETRSLRVKLKNDVPPEVRVFAPMNRSVIKTNSWTKVEIKASDEDGFIDKVYLLVDGIPVGDPLSAPPFLFDFRPPVDGSYQISARAIDDDGNDSLAPTISVVANKSGIVSGDEEFPEVRITSPLNKATFSEGSSVSIKADAFDTDGHIQEVRIFVDGIQVGNTLYSSPFQVSYSPPTTGSFQVWATAVDNHDNASTSSTITFLVN